MSDRLDYLRSQIEAETISYSEIEELQNLGAEGLIPEGDVLLLEWAGVPEFPEHEDEEGWDDVPKLIAGVIDDLFMGHDDWNRKLDQVAEIFANRLSQTTDGNFDRQRFIDVATGKRAR